MRDINLERRASVGTGMGRVYPPGERGKGRAMPDRLAIKELTGSDLTFFDSIFKRSNVGNQKAINLNADVFADVLYPDFAERSQGREVETPVAVTLYGPRPGKPYRFTRSITKKQKYKNWRLNGAALLDPEDEPGRFDHLTVGDIAVFEFEGDAAPESIRLIIVSSNDDPELRDALQAETPGGRKTMAPISRSRLSEIAAEVGLSTHHPIQVLLRNTEIDELLEQASLGVEPAVRKLRERAGPHQSKEDLAKARERAERVGDDGEALAHVLLLQMVTDGQLPGIIWTSSENAAAPWDFETVGTPMIRFDAKATTRRFEAPFFLSAAEAVAASSDEAPYRIVRIYELTEEGAVARISEDINYLAKSIIASTEALPDGVLPAGFSVDPHALKWGKPIEIERPDEPDDGAEDTIPPR